MYSTADIDLSDSITNYKMLLIVGQQVTSTYYSSTAYIPVTHFKTNCADASHILYTAPATGGAGVYYSTDTKLIAQRHDSQNVNVWVYGIK